VVERYRLVDYGDAKDAMQRGTKENRRAGGPYNPNYEDKYLQVQFTIEKAPHACPRSFAKLRRSSESLCESKPVWQDSEITEDAQFRPRTSCER